MCLKKRNSIQYIWCPLRKSLGFTFCPLNNKKRPQGTLQTLEHIMLFPLKLNTCVYFYINHGAQFVLSLLLDRFFLHLNMSCQRRHLQQRILTTAAPHRASLSIMRMSAFDSYGTFTRHVTFSSTQ